MSTALAQLKQTIAAQLAQQRDALPPSEGSTIRVDRSKTFHFPDGTTTAGPFDAVIIGWRFVNAWYSKPFREGDPVSPDCWAQGQNANVLTPDAAAKKVQHTDCESCPKNQWGSSPTGGKLCKNIIKLAVVPPDADPKTRPLIIKTSPTATEVITLVGCDPNKEYPTLAVQKGEQHDNLEVIAGLAEKANEILDQDFSRFDD
jgi:hypothetical protein